LTVSISKLRDEDRPVSEIARLLGVAPATVQYHLRKPDRPPATAKRGRRPAIPDAPCTREMVAMLLERGVSRAETARRLGLSRSTVSYHAKLLGGTIDRRFAVRYDWEKVQAYYDTGRTVRECAAAFGFSTWSWQQAVRRGDVRARPTTRPFDETFAPNTHRSRGYLKARLLRLGLKRDSCEACGVNIWLGAPLSLALHHVNGDRLDNRLENLQLLCPNCHSQTDTFAGRNGSSRR
jgi:DNA-binding CsgD family transcriptional regulator